MCEKNNGNSGVKESSGRVIAPCGKDITETVRLQEIIEAQVAVSGLTWGEAVRRSLGLYAISPDMLSDSNSSGKDNTQRVFPIMANDGGINPINKRYCKSDKNDLC